ncbi:hypothetical protein JXA88_06840 [Candidatus Fermentibacteria bacterium]|nr:hypothetical protein [Candidatus Fermentibacteria bacterium]
MALRRPRSVSAAVLAVAVAAVTATETPAPVLLYGPDVQRAPDSAVSSATRFRPGEPVPLGDPFTVGSGRSFILIATGQLVQMTTGTEALFSADGTELRIRRGSVTLHADLPNDSLRVWLVTEGATIRNLGDTLRVVINGQRRRLLRGDVVRGEKALGSGGAWVKSDEADGGYLLGLVRSGALPARDFTFRLPSLRPRRVRHDLHGYTGVATYEGTRYYLAELTYRLQARQLRLAYDLWFAVSRDGRFYSEAWDQWKDLVDHVNHVQIFMPGDPLFVRMGHIERLSYGRGLLMDNYTNAVFLPFERRTGLLTEARMFPLTLQLFMNDIGKPRVAGGCLLWTRPDRVSAMLTYVGDFDQYSNIRDRDGDSYPDQIDPEPDVVNAPSDSIIHALQPVSLDSLSRQSLHGFAVGFDYRYLRTEHAQLRLEGELSALSNGGVGTSFPAMALQYRGVTLGIGIDFQTPRFEAAVFDGTYELDKARFLLQPDSTLRLVSRGSELARTDEWLYGWSNRLVVEIGDNFFLQSRFRDVYRGDYRNKLFRLAAESSFPFLAPITRIGVFIEQRNVSRLLRERTDGEIWGVEVCGTPHRSLLVKTRYRERYSDDNASGIIEDNEVSRSFSASMTVDGGYWWRQYQQWRRRRAGEDEAAAD